MQVHYLFLTARPTTPFCTFIHFEHFIIYNFIFLIVYIYLIINIWISDLASQDTFSFRTILIYIYIDIYIFYISRLQCGVRVYLFVYICNVCLYASMYVG